MEGNRRAAAAGCRLSCPSGGAPFRVGFVVDHPPVLTERLLFSTCCCGRLSGDGSPPCGAAVTAWKTVASAVVPLPRLPADSLYLNKGHACCACGGLGAFSRCLLGACVRHSRGRDGSSARNGRRFSYGRSPCLKAQYIQPCSPVAVSCLGPRLWVKIGTGRCGNPRHGSGRHH